MSVAVDCVFEGFQAFCNVLYFLFKDFVHLPRVNAFLVMPAVVFIECKKIVAWDTGARILSQS